MDMTSLLIIFLSSDLFYM